MEQVASSLVTHQGTQPVEVTFDDGTADHFQAAQLLQELGVTGVFFIITEKIGAPGYLSASQIGEIAKMGHRFGSHSITHRHLPTLSLEELRIELRDSREILADLTGHAVDWLAPPGGVVDRQCLAMADSLGYRVVRTMQWGYSSFPLQGPVKCIPIVATVTRRRMAKILDGKAHFHIFQAKEALKRIAGERVYSSFRDRFISARS